MKVHCWQVAELGHRFIGSQMAIVHFILYFMEIITRTSLLLVSVYDKLESESGLLANGPTRSHFSFADTTSTNILFFAILLCNL